MEGKLYRIVRGKYRIGCKPINGVFVQRSRVYTNYLQRYIHAAIVIKIVIRQVDYIGEFIILIQQIGFTTIPDIHANGRLVGIHCNVIAHLQAILICQFLADDTHLCSNILLCLGETTASYDVCCTVLEPAKAVQIIDAVQMEHAIVDITHMYSILQPLRIVWGRDIFHIVVFIPPVTQRQAWWFRFVWHIDRVIVTFHQAGGHIQLH